VKTFSLILTSILSSLFFSTAMAANLKLGEYRGTSNDGRECYIKVTSSDINAGYRDGVESIWRAHSAFRNSNNESIEGNVYRHRSSADGSKLVIDAELNSAGAIKVAKINIGLTGWFGKTCKMK
jgi:hypothetical protein